MPQGPEIFTDQSLHVAIAFYVSGSGPGYVYAYGGMETGLHN